MIVNQLPNPSVLRRIDKQNSLDNQTKLTKNWDFMVDRQSHKVSKTLWEEKVLLHCPLS
jgi:hypothetical protein